MIETLPEKPKRPRLLSTGIHKDFSICTGLPTSFPRKPPRSPIVSLQLVLRPTSMPVHSVMAKKTVHSGQIVLFPGAPSEMGNAQVGKHNVVPGAAVEALDLRNTGPISEEGPCHVVLSGSYRKDFEALRTTYHDLLDLGCQILSPSNMTAVRESDGFVFMKGEELQSPDAIEGRHLDAIQRATFVWLHDPEGYVGPTASLEIGFAKAIGVPVFAKETVKDPALRSFVEVISSPAAAIDTIKTSGYPIPRPALTAFQYYYRRVAIQRGYKSEGPKDCLLLMVEEVGELAREIRRRERLVRHGQPSESSESKELADIFLYVVHMANVLDIDLSKVVQEKELINLQRFLRK